MKSQGLQNFMSEPYMRLYVHILDVCTMSAIWQVHRYLVHLHNVRKYSEVYLIPLQDYSLCIRSSQLLLAITSQEGKHVWTFKKFISIASICSKQNTKNRCLSQKPLFLQTVQWGSFFFHTLSIQPDWWFCLTVTHSANCEVLEMVIGADQYHVQFNG